MRNPKVEEWEDRLEELLRDADRELELRFGGEMPLHPARPEAGATANPQQDGLFRVTSTFTPGFGSELGRGYVLKVDIVTLRPVPDELRRAAEAAAVEYIGARLEEVFPDRGMRINRDGGVWKISGDLRL